MDSGPFPAPPVPGQWDQQGRRGRRRGGGGSGGGGGGGPRFCYEAGAPPPQEASFPCMTSAPMQSSRLGLDDSFSDVATQSSAAEMQKEQRIKRMLLEFKTVRCTSERRPLATHDHRCCPFFHSERDRRRPVFILDADGGPVDYCYVAEPCNESFDDPKTVCSRMDACTLSHSTAELLYHPEFFRKRLCHQAARCPRGRLCAFAHSRQELLVPHFSKEEEDNPSEEFIAWHFKTQWCPIGGPHDWETCVYAHTYRDWRRTPAIGYSSWPCTSWAQSVASGPTELVYHLRCPNGMACSLAHGAKEQLYHPHFYKTSPCSEGNCKRGPLCAFTHGEADTRGPTPAPITNEEAAAKAMQGPLQWAEATLAHHQPSYCNPPRYHALEEQVNVRKGGKGGKKGGAVRRGAEARMAMRERQCGTAKRRQQPAMPVQQGREYRADPGEFGKARSLQSPQQPYYWQMAASMYADQPADLPAEQQPYGFSAPIMWAHQAQMPDGSVQSFPATFLNMGSDASARFPGPGIQQHQQQQPDETSPLSAAVAAANACGSPMAVPIQGSNYSFEIPTSMWGGISAEKFEKGSRNRLRKGQAIRTPSSFGSLGSPRESLTPTETPRTRGTPLPGEEVATSSQTSSSAHTSGHRPRTLSVDRGLHISKAQRHRTHSVDDQALRTPTKGSAPSDEPPTISTSWASSESA